MICSRPSPVDYLTELEGVQKPVYIVWGDQDHLARQNVLDAYRALPARAKNVDIHILRGVQHSYMMQGNTRAFEQQAYDLSVERALALLDRLRNGNDAKSN